MAMNKGRAKVSFYFGVGSQVDYQV